MMGEISLSLRELERACHARDHAHALQQLRAMLEELEATGGDLRISEPAFDVDESSRSTALLARAASAVSSLFADPGFELARQDFDHLIVRHHWLCALFAASPFGDADHVLRAMSTNAGEDGIELPPGRLLKFLLMVTPESEIRLDVDALWRADATATASLCLSLLAGRFSGTRVAHRKREILLDWLPARLAGLCDRAAELPIGLFPRVGALCSNGRGRGKHEIKRPLNAMLHRLLEARGLRDLEGLPALGGKPSMFVALDAFDMAHPLYRTHSASLRAARAHFHLIGLGPEAGVDALGRAVFDEFIPIDADPFDAAATVRALAIERRPQVVFLPCAGLTLQSSLLANLRLAPLQVAAWGHPATTHATAIDDFVVEEDFAGDPQDHSEALLVLPRDALCLVPRGERVQDSPEGLQRAPSGRVRIAIVANLARLSADFLEACAEIRAASPRPLEFHFFAGDARGVLALHFGKSLRRWLKGDAALHAGASPEQVLYLLRACDLFLEPFPVGRIDALLHATEAGLAGVCMAGREVHARIGAAVFERLALPEWLVTQTPAEFVDAALRLVADDALRDALRAELVQPGRLDAAFMGRPERLGERLLARLGERTAGAVGVA